MRRETKVDLPDPEGAEMMKTVVIGSDDARPSTWATAKAGLLKIEPLFTYSFDVSFYGQGAIGDAQSGFARVGAF